MSWNYRVVRKNARFGPVYTIHEAYYDENEETPRLITVEPMAPLGDTFKELKQDLKWMKKALSLPVIDWDEWQEKIKDRDE